MNYLYMIGGIACLAFGLYLTMKRIKIFMAGKQDKLGFDIQLFGAGIMGIMIGIYLMVKYF